MEVKVGREVYEGSKGTVFRATVGEDEVYVVRCNTTSLTIFVAEGTRCHDLNEATRVADFG